MDDRYGIEQRLLRRVSVRWGPQERRHLAMVPLFDPGYKVLGLVGLDSDAPPRWYPGVPLTVERGRMVFRSSLSTASPEWSDVPPELLTECYFLDPWGAILALVPHVPGGPSLAGAVNLAGCRIRGERIVDIVFEPALHRVRALQLRGRWRRSGRVQVLRLPPLSQCLQRPTVPQLDAAALGAPPERPQGMLERFVRVLAQPLPPAGDREP
jgi:hypothetical protein